MSKSTWLERYRAADSLYTQQECGCLALVLIDLPEVVRDSQAEITEQALKGRTLHRVPRSALPPLNCEAHKRATDSA